MCKLRHKNALAGSGFSRNQQETPCGFAQFLGETRCEPVAADEPRVGLDVAMHQALEEQIEWARWVCAHYWPLEAGSMYWKQYTVPRSSPARNVLPTTPTTTSLSSSPD